MLVKVGQQAPNPFVDYQELAENLPHDQQVKVMGASNFKLWQSGKVDWKDIVTPSRIRPLHQVVALQKLSVKDMVGVGIRPDIARAAHAAVNTPAHQAINAHRRQLLQNLANAGVSHQQVVQHLAPKIASRATIAAGPTYTTKTATAAGPAGTVLPGTPAGRLPPPAAPRQNHAKELYDVLGSGKEINKAIAALKRAPKPKPAALPPIPSSKATVAYADEGWEDVARGIFRRPVAARNILDVTGAPSGKADIHVLKGGLYIEVEGDHFRLNRTISRGPDGPVLRAEYFEVDESHRGRGLGADVFGRMVESARANGVRAITTSASRELGHNGYYTWARFGYDAPIPAGIAERLPPSLAGARHVSDLMATPDGSEWWKTHGDTVEMTFDLTPGSKSLEVWDAYRKAKAAQRMAAATP